MVNRARYPSPVMTRFVFSLISTKTDLPHVSKWLSQPLPLCAILLPQPILLRPLKTKMRSLLLLNPPEHPAASPVKERTQLVTSPCLGLVVPHRPRNRRNSFPSQTWSVVSIQARGTVNSHWCPLQTSTYLQVACGSSTSSCYLSFGAQPCAHTCPATSSSALGMPE
jgi:hypothetical protein